jgi:hypothetical protein
MNSVPTAAASVKENIDFILFVLFVEWFVVNTGNKLVEATNTYYGVKPYLYFEPAILKSTPAARSKRAAGLNLTVRGTVAV